MADYKQIRVRRDTLANWQTANPVLADGELAWVTDTRDMISGDGNSSFDALWSAAQSIPNRAAAAATAAAGAASDAAASAAAAAGATSAVPGAIDLATYGDSITESGQGGGVKWPQMVSDYLGLSLYNPSVSGEAPPDIAVRQGGLAPQVTVSGNAIPASGPVSVTTITPSTGWRTLPNEARIGRFQGRLCGVSGELRNNNGTWTFTRTTAGDPVPCPPLSRFRTDGGKAARDAVQILWPGRNYPDQTVVMRDLASMTAYLDTPKRFLVYSVLNTADEVKGTTSYNAIIAINTAIAAAYPDSYFDMRAHLIANGLAEAGITPTAQDQTDIANDCVPSSLRADPTHPNAAGIRVIARKTALLLLGKGWASTAQAFIPAPANVPQVLSLPSASAKASRASTTDIASLTTLSLEVFFTPTSAVPTGPVPLLMKQSSAGGAKFGLYVKGDGNMRFQSLDSSGAQDFRDTTGGPAFTVGTATGVRVDYIPTNNQLDFYRSSDAGATWTKFFSASMNATPNTTDTSPLEIVGIAANVQRVRVLDGARSTVYLDRNFTTGAGDFTLSGGAEMLGTWPYA